MKNITIYSNSCTTCGRNAVYVARVRNAYPHVQVVNSRADKSRLQEHLKYQSMAGMGEIALPIVVEDDGAVVTLLNEWKS